MEKSKKLKIIEEMQLVVDQMRKDDLEQNSSLADELYDCDCCAKTKPVAGSVMYGNLRLCNDCVLLAEIGFALDKIKDINDLMEIMEDKRLEYLCEYIKQEEKNQQN